MLPQIIRRGSGPNGYNIWGLQFSEQFVRGIDAGLIMCFFYMVIVEISTYSKYQKEGKCTKPFGIFWIGQYTSIILSRLLWHLERHFHYRLALMFLERNIRRLRTARFRVYFVSVCKLLAYSGFLVFTILGGVWFARDGRCLNNVNKSSQNRSEIKMAFWLSASFAVCLIYVKWILSKLIYERSPGRELMEDDATGEVNNVLQVEQVRRPEGRNLTQRELKAIKKSKLAYYDELSRFANEQPRLSQQVPNEMGTSATNEQIPMQEDSAEKTDESDYKRNCIEPSQGGCAVCLENIEIGAWYKKLPDCHHCFHANCIDLWLSTRATCPICRNEVFIDERTLQS